MDIQTELSNIQECLIKDQQEIQDVNIMSISEIPDISIVINYMNHLKENKEIILEEINEIERLIQNCCDINDLETGNCFMYKSDYVNTFGYIEKIKKML